MHSLAIRVRSLSQAHDRSETSAPVPDPVGVRPQGKLLATIFFNLMLNEYAAAQERSVAKRSRHQWSRSTVQSAST